MKKFFLQLHERMGILTILVIGLCMVSFGLLANSFALSQPVPKITFSSQKLSYTEKKPGSWNVEKSAERIGEGEARITFQVDSTLMMNNKYTDVILVLDISGSMAGEKMDRVKEDSKELITSLLSDSHNQAALITFDTESEIISQFTNKKDELIKKIDQLVVGGVTNYYQPLVRVDSLLKNYQKKTDTECVVLFLTDGFPNEDVPNQISEYEYLKSEYPWLNIHGVQYEMGEEILSPIKEISDEQFIADMDTLNNVLFDASVTPTSYENFILTDFINNTYFNLDEVSQIKASFGIAKLTQENGVPKVTWDLSGLKSGRSATLTIDIDLKKEYFNQGGIYPTNKSSEVTSKIETNEENITTKESPSLQTHYQVVYEGNAPTGCSVSGVPNTTSHLVFSTVAKSEEVPSCEGYQFKGWMIVTEGVEKLNDDYFRMPEKDVTLRAEWGKITISKSMSGTVYTKPIPKLQNVGSSIYKEKLWQYKDSITKVIISDEIDAPEGSTSDLTWDISAYGRGVMGYLVPNSGGTNTYIAYIQGEGEIIANEDSSYLFSGFSKLTTIEGLELLDTSQVTDMSYMFNNCKQLTNLNVSYFVTDKVTNMRYMFMGCAITSLDVSHFVTDKVTDMYGMLRWCSNLTSLNLSGWNTSQVTNMSEMFCGCSSLTSLDVSHFVTDKVTDMRFMFENCSSLASLDLNSWDVSQVTDMSYMFDNCSSLASLNLSEWNTSQVTNMSYMFVGCAITSLDLSNWDTSQVTNMMTMFNACVSLMDLDLSNWNTSQVTSMNAMFMNCYELTSLDLNDWDTSNVTDMRGMFNGCSKLLSLDLNSWNVSQVTDMGDMFENCSSLTSLDLSKWSNLQVTSMYQMFYNCSSLTNLDLSAWKVKTENVNIDDMFDGCGTSVSSFKLDLSNWNFSNIRDDINNMFNGRNKIAVAELVMRNCQIGNKTSLSNLFGGLSTIKKMDLSNWDVSNVTDFSGMFNGCSSLTNLDLSGWDTSQAINMGGMFYNCQNLTTTTINILNPSVTSYSGMFSGAAIASNAQITVGYNLDTSTLVDKMINTKSTASRVVKKMIPVVVETSHYPYPSNLSDYVLFERTFEGAKSITISSKFATRNMSYDFIKIYTSPTNSSTTYGSMNSSNEYHTHTMTINGNYIKITMTTDGTDNDAYGFYTEITPNY